MIFMVANCAYQQLEHPDQLWSPTEVPPSYNVFRSCCINILILSFQEDLDSMYQELEMWRKENATHAEALRREEKYVTQITMYIYIVVFFLESMKKS